MEPLSKDTPDISKIAVLACFMVVLLLNGTREGGREGGGGRDEQVPMVQMATA